MTEGFCVKCKEKREIQDEESVVMKNGRKAKKGKCPTCGTGMYRIGGWKRCGLIQGVTKQYQQH